MPNLTLRVKFLLALASISALLTWATLLVVRGRVEVRARQEIAEALQSSVVTFQSLQQQREQNLERTAALLAELPPLKAVMTSQHMATIQDASAQFWSLAGSQLLVLADESGSLMAMHTAQPAFTRRDAQYSLMQSLGAGNTRDWWFGGGRLFEVFLQRMYFGPRENNTPMGILAIGYEIDERMAADVSRVASGRVAFQYRGKPVAGTLPAGHVELDRRAGVPREVQVGRERFLATSVTLSPTDPQAVTLTVLKSYDQVTAFLSSLNRWIVAVGIAAVLAGSLLVFFVSTTFTRPLAELVGGVRALEKGDFAYPLQPRGSDEVSVVTAAFDQMRVRLRETQTRLLEAERLATIGRMASMISHDLRHPLTAILAYAEFLSERNLTEAQRLDCYQEIRIAVNRMTDEISSLLGFSKQREPLKRMLVNAEEVLAHAVQAVKVLPEHENLTITLKAEGNCSAWVDPAKLERAVLNLLFNACEAIAPDSGRIEVSCRGSGHGLEIRVADNGSGIPDEIRRNLFQPFASFGKAKGIGLGLTVVQKIARDHGGDVCVERSDATGTVFRIDFPALRENDPDALQVASSV